jgi:ubiquinone/menaquinone biosynthesis C-methylase UbiE
MNTHIQSRFEKLAAEGAWSSRYGSLDSLTYNFISRRDSVKQLLKNKVFSLALDLGCGTGDYAAALTDCVKQYVGVDFASTMIKKAKEKYAKFTPVPFFGISCAERLPFKDNTFDLITAIGFIEYFENPKITMLEIVRVLKPGGTIVIQSWNPGYCQRILRLGIFRHMYLTLRRIKKYLRDSGNSFDEKAYVDIPYSKNELDRLMENFGFRNIAYSYSNFALFPQLIRKLFPKIYIDLSKVISHNNPNWFAAFAINYIGCYVLDSDKLTGGCRIGTMKNFAYGGGYERRR